MKSANAKILQTLAKILLFISIVSSIIGSIIIWIAAFSSRGNTSSLLILIFSGIGTLVGGIFVSLLIYYFLSCIAEITENSASIDSKIGYQTFENKEYFKNNIEF